MTSNQPIGNEKKFWTPLRVVSTLVVLSLIIVTGISSCSSSDENNNGVAGVASQPENNSPANNVPPVRANNAPANNVPPVRANNPPPAEAVVALPTNVRDAKLKTMSGGTIKLADYSGKVILVNLWATWCGPCRAETPELVKLHKEFQSRGVEMVGLSTEDPDGSADSVKNFVSNYQVDYHIGWAPPEVSIAFMQMTQRDAIPQSFIISRDGRILNKFVGFSPVYTPPQIKQALEEALNYKG
jgi:cytochrome c biogenesis protein CcmG, thiol:disulfide interchange protein DsbE